MPIVSKYQSDKVEKVIDEVIDVLEKHDAPLDLGLMVLGNAAANIINASLSPKQRQAVAEKFAKALVASVKSKDTSH
ncbi:MAG: DUF1414 domain-containing protein [Moritella sp.]|uniref:DUF1414 domain-containing protein n=1 Tax=unclassified Moritella TaxID=2637987 RepID=UPI000156919F|nr:MULTISPECIES: DUF1414 domain-containing protein [unclassified Moritella]EDM64651.1 hypothetical protein PE36_01317 [Moritella sp. PE36]NQZ93461.1 DUF1414 domain-containing protein [Moritella sp.]PHR88414.1 MAG: hypothetical protein COA76_07885 [Moritella sp.]